MYRHRYRQFFRFQGTGRGRPRTSTAILLSAFQLIANVGGRMRTTANCSVAGELGFEPRQTESESVVLPLHHSPIFSDTYWIFLQSLRRAQVNPRALCRSTRRLPSLASGR